MLTIPNGPIVTPSLQTLVAMTADWEIRLHCKALGALWPVQLRLCRKLEKAHAPPSGADDALDMVIAAWCLGLQASAVGTWELA